MATLQNTTINGILTATNIFTSPKILNEGNTRYIMREYGGAVNIPNSGTNYVDLFVNTGVHERMYGLVSWKANHGWISSGSFYYHISEYGLNTQIFTNSDPTHWSVSRYNPTYGTNHLRFHNTAGYESNPIGIYYFVVQAQSSDTFSSPYLTRVR